MGRKFVVLLVENHPGVRDVLERMVESWDDVELLSCAGFIAASILINEVPRIDLMLCDTCLPEQMTGTDVAELLLELHPRAAIVMTSADPRASVPRFRERYGFVRKPFNRCQLFEAIDRAFVQLEMDAVGDVTRVSAIDLA